MHYELPLNDKTLIPQPEACRMTGRSRSGLRELRKNDPDFPKPIKAGHTRQARCYYVVEEIHGWLQIQASKREEQV
ncbi:helix-turn-helix transcriptional regulator [Stutzerimonas chloritidismutans]